MEKVLFLPLTFFSFFLEGGVISGRVFGAATGEPLRGVKVLLVPNHYYQSWKVQVETNSEGRFFLEGVNEYAESSGGSITPILYRFTLSKKGYRTFLSEFINLRRSRGRNFSSLQMEKGKSDTTAPSLETMSFRVSTLDSFLKVEMVFSAQDEELPVQVYFHTNHPASGVNYFKEREKYIYERVAYLPSPLSSEGRKVFVCAEDLAGNTAKRSFVITRGTREFF